MNRSNILGVFLFCIFLAACNEQATEPSARSYQRTPASERLIVQCAVQCAETAADITRLGASITKRYRNVAALAITVPSDQIAKLGVLSSVKAFTKDKVVHIPIPSRSAKVAQLNGTKLRTIRGADLADLRASQPKNYLLNSIMTGADVLFEQGITGKGVIVAVIDSGTANNADVVPALEDTVIGGESFIDLPDEPSATSTLNDAHGTMVGTMIAAHVAFVLPNDDDLVQSLMTHAPDSLIAVSATESAVPMLGTAPEASIYALKVFSAQGNGTDSSTVLAAMDRAITLKRNYIDGNPSDPIAGDGSEEKPFVYDSLNIQVANMSLGGPSLFPGFEVDDLLTLEMLKAGITIVVSAGNEGSAAMTGGSPGTGFGALTIGAANEAIHERIIVDLTFGLGEGILFRPSDALQTATFSSRGPTADGRYGVSLIANGTANFVQAADGGLALVSGTSFSSPTVAGGAALLQSAVPDATAAQIRSALMTTANPGMVGDKSSRIDQGSGFIDLAAASESLMSGDVEDDIPELPQLSRRATQVSDAIKKAGYEPIELDDDAFSAQVELVPGQVAHFFIPAAADTGSIRVQLTDIKAELPPEEQNVLFGDDILLTIVDAPTSINDVLFDDFVADDISLDFAYPQTGLLRVAVVGDWTNAGKISATLHVSARSRSLSSPVARGSIEDNETDTIQLNVKSGTKQAVFELAWKNNWAYYPTHDIDLILEDPDGNIVFDGATLRSPERVIIDDPAPGVWIAYIDGYMLHGFEDNYVLRATDHRGKSLKRVR